MSEQRKMSFALPSVSHPFARADPFFQFGRVIEYTDFSILLVFVLLFTVATAVSNETDNRVPLADVIVQSATSPTDDPPSMWWIIPAIAAALFTVCVITFGIVKILDKFGFAIGKFKVEMEFSPVIYLDRALRHEFMSKIEQWLGGDDVELSGCRDHQQLATHLSRLIRSCYTIPK